MAAPKIELRMAALEEQVAELKQQINGMAHPAKPWWQEIYGSFADDPLYEKAMLLGREYRESLRPKPAQRATKPSTKSAAKSAAKLGKR